MKQSSTLVVKAIFTLVIVCFNLFSAKSQTVTPSSDSQNSNLNVQIATDVNATVANKSIVLNWLTTAETNINYYEIERSLDLKKFGTLGLVLDGFEAGAGKSYAFKDNSSELTGKSVVYYRIKQIDNDDKFYYSKVIAVRL